VPPSSATDTLTTGGNPISSSDPLGLWTANLGASFGFQVGSFSFSYGAGIAVDGAGNVGSYGTLYVGAGVGAGVVFAHAACELHTESELIRLVAARPDKTLGELVLPSEREVKTLANPQVRRIYSALTGDHPAGSKEPKRPCADWWEQWNTSRKDRHNVAHKGAQMTEAQAAAAIDVADRYIKHLTEKVETALVRPQP
jgi:hypothetical protein